MSLPNFFPYLYLFFVVLLSIWHSSIPFVKSPASTSFFNVSQCSSSSYHWPFFSLPTYLCPYHVIHFNWTYLFNDAKHISIGEKLCFCPNISFDMERYHIILTNWPVSAFPCLMGKLERNLTYLFRSLPLPFPYGERNARKWIISIY